MTSLRALRPAFPILLGASLMLTLSMGIRQSLGIFMQPLTRDIGISISEFTVAIAIQNLAWGFTQPIAGAYAARISCRQAAGRCGSPKTVRSCCGIEYLSRSG